MNIHDYDWFIIEKQRHYLQKAALDGNHIWTRYKWDAARIRRRDIARMVARKTGGRDIFFNNISGETRQ